MVDEIDPESVKEKLDSGEEVQIVDIRAEDDYKRGHIPNAINIPMARLPAEIDKHEWGDDIVVACPIGQSSIQAARLLESYEGIRSDARVASMRGGYDSWEYELESSEEAEA